MVKQSQKKDCIVILEKKVFNEQIKMALLAQKLGIIAKKVLNTQIKLARSYDFRLLAVWKTTKNTKINIFNFATVFFANGESIKFIVNKLLVFLDCPYKYKLLPVRKCFIAKSLVARKLVGISAVQDRCLQILMRLVLDPVMESFSDTNSFGFRKNRQFKSALAVVKYLLKDKYCDKLILNASVKIFCDNLLYDWLFKNVPLTHILKNFLTNWFKSKIVFQQGDKTPYMGTLQGSIISSVFNNFLLDGLEEKVVRSVDLHVKCIGDKQAISCKNVKCEVFTKQKSLKFRTIRYVDTFVVFATSKRILEVIKFEVILFIQKRGLFLSQKNLSILNFRKKSFNFLNYTFKFRKCWNPKYSFLKEHVGESGIAMYPEKSKVHELIYKLRKIFRKNINIDSYNLIAVLNPIIRRWINYFNLSNSLVFCNYARQGLYRQSWKWACRKHAKWGKTRIAVFYFIDDKNNFVKSRKWTFYGKVRKGSGYKKNIGGNIIYLVDPTNVVSMVSVLKYAIPEQSLRIHVFSPS